MIPQPTLEFAASDEIAGFRLERLELYNWGTFHNHVWSLSPSGRNLLVTGDIGSGKSTLVDAITTLLVPPARLAYNKAAGADTRERSLRTYVLGYYKSERSDTGMSSKPVAFRDHNNFSVILGVFTNEGYSQTISLAQVFSCREPTGQPDRFYVIADKALSIEEHFANFGSELAGLKKKLKTHKATLYESFSSYCAEFKRHFGIGSEQALELFNQTVSMKSVGNLTSFVREHMLQELDVKERIAQLLKHYDDLHRAHKLVLTAKDQIAKLSEIVAGCDQQDEMNRNISAQRQNRDCLRHYFAAGKSDLLRHEQQALTGNLARLGETIADLQHKNSELQVSRDDLKQQIATNGGDRIAHIKAKIVDKTREKESAVKKSDKYQKLAQRLELKTPGSIDQFQQNCDAIAQMRPQFVTTDNELQKTITDHEVETRDLNTRKTALEVEIDSLKRRRSNIPGAQVAIRASLCAAVEINEQQLPFAGELIQIHPSEQLWEGAAERLLHNFALSLLVPEKHYAKVSEWVDKTNLRGRLVYFRVKKEARSNAAEPQPQSLISKLELKADSEFYDWLAGELGQRFDYTCCDSMEQFRKEHQAISRNGQFKSGGQRHEKDDRHSIADRSRYVLGWSNEAKIKALNTELQSVLVGLSRKAEILTTCRADKAQNLERKSAAEQLSVFESYSEIDWKRIAGEIADLEAEQKKLEAASDILRQLSQTLKELETKMQKVGNSLEEAKAKHTRAEVELEKCREQLKDLEPVLREFSTGVMTTLCATLDKIRKQVQGDTVLTLRNIGEIEGKMRDHLQNRIDSESRRLKAIEEKIVSAMQNYKRDYPVETQEYDARAEASAEYRESLKKLREDSLPAFEERFKRLLNENTINEIANFHSQLNCECQKIRERIGKINESLAEIEYNKGRYIQLDGQLTPDADIRDFKQELKACTEDSLTGSEDEQYAENKFLLVKAIIERFRGREGLVESDQRWVRKVTDVRNWFVFAASERWLEDNSEYEHYTDSGGKSGGQKEKLAYTVLAASLAYQFGLERRTVKSRSFRFVVIDEAFGRGSDESTRYALELFRQLNLQLLIVTPLQKIHVIEPYVESVGFVHSNNESESLLRNLTISEYRAEREAR